MRVWDTMCATMLSTGARRGAMMATLRCDHPDIERFVDAKMDATELRHFNVSVLVSDSFMNAVETDGDWPLVFPAGQLSAADRDRYPQVVERPWSGTQTPCRVLKHLKARDLWQRILRASYEYAEPGVLFIDRINRSNNLWYCEAISATNPCGEVPLPPYGACDLGSLNLTRFVRGPFTAGASLDLDGLAGAARIATRMLDNVIDVSSYPLEIQRRHCVATRRIGLGITGLADALVMLGLRYASAAANREAERLMRTVCHAAYGTSVSLAREKGPFEKLSAREYLAGEFTQSLPETIRSEIADTGIRNSHLIAIAPTGTVSLLADNISSGIEPVYAPRYQRAVLTGDGGSLSFELEDYACRMWRRNTDDDSLPPQFVSVAELLPEDHLSVQAALQPYVDNAISKTVNLAPDVGFETFQCLYQRAYELGLKGCTAFRSNPVTGEVLTPERGLHDTPHCCSIEREAD
jgi:ribonucleoside-diphosphate reductase alpha chain